MFRPHPILQFESEVLDIRDITNDVKEFDLSVPDNFAFTPGQFVTILFEANGQKYRRQYSIYSQREKRPLTLCVKEVKEGPGTVYLWNLKKGDIIKVMGPLGVFVVREEHKDKPLVFIATGTGIAPFVSAIPELVNQQKEVYLFSGFRYNILADDVFKSIQSKSFHYYPILSRHGEAPRGYVQDNIKKQLPNNFDAHYYICGLSKMIFDVIDVLKEKGVPEEHIHFERYD